MDHPSMPFLECCTSYRIVYGKLGQRYYKTDGNQPRNKFSSGMKNCTDNIKVKISSSILLMILNPILPWLLHDIFESHEAIISESLEMTKTYHGIRNIKLTF